MKKILLVLFIIGYCGFCFSLNTGGGGGGGNGGGSWGSITGLINSQQDLKNVLDNKTTLSEVRADIDISDAINKKHANTLDHSHSNKTQLDLITNGAHDVSPHAPANAQKNSDITKEEIEAKLTGTITSHTHPDSGSDNLGNHIATTTLIMGNYDISTSI